MVHCRSLCKAVTGGWLISLILLTGCTSTATPSNVQVVDRTAPVRTQAAQPIVHGHYTVRPGDTLYGIAFRFGWDWKALAAQNQISAPYTIKPGQRIFFNAGSAVRPASTAAPATPKVATPVRPPAPTPVIAATKPAPSSAVVAKNTPPVANPPAATPVAPPVQSAGGWAWPTSGSVIGRFSSNASLNKGIDIAGNLGQPILAASSGTVVYAGSGLRGYGELVIIKHSDTYVSAYGHNRKLLVREGQQVKAGQAIAEMGSTGTDRVKLHFEIRKQGKPVDPLQYLPRR